MSMVKRTFEFLWKRRLFRFGVVGGVCTGIDLAVANLALISAVAEPSSFRIALAKMAGFLVASCAGFILHGNLTYGSRQPLTSKRYVRFVAISGSGVLVNTFCAVIFFTFFREMMPFVVAANSAFLAATIVSMVWNYVGYTRAVFSRS